MTSPTLRQSTLSLALLLGIACSALGQPAALINPVGAAPPPAAAPPAGPLTLDQALDVLAARGQTLDSFVADVKLTEKDESTQLESARVGKVWYQRLADGGARIRVSFTSRSDDGGKHTKVNPLDYVLDKGWLLERDHTKKIQIRRQVMKPGEKANLLKLGEGPFPLPIGQKTEDVKKQFAVTLAKPTKDDPAGTTHVVLRPREGTQLKRRFSLIDVYVDPKTQMPAKIDTLDNKETTTKSTELTNLIVNPKLVDNDFSLPQIDETKWNVREEPFKE
jgi:hypothetical protein